jgi:hypothetical protein
MYKEATVAYFEVLSHNLPGGTEKSLSEYMTSAYHYTITFCLANEYEVHTALYGFLTKHHTMKTYGRVDI